MTKHQYNS
jgi:hypothetical protein